MAINIFDARENAAIGDVIIEKLIPLLRNGWIAMDKDGDWCWYEHKPVCVDVENCHEWLREDINHKWCNLSRIFKIVSSPDGLDWKKSLREVKND